MKEVFLGLMNKYLNLLIISCSKNFIINSLAPHHLNRPQKSLGPSNSLILSLS